MTVSRTGNSGEVFKFPPEFPKDRLGGYFRHLPGEILGLVLSNMSGWELAQKIALLNKAFSEIVRDNSLWKERTITRFPEASFDSSKTEDVGYWRGKYIELCNKQVSSNISIMRKFTQPHFWRWNIMGRIYGSRITEDQDYLMILIERVEAIYMEVWKEKELKTDLDFQRRIMELHGLSKVSWSAFPKLLFSQLVSRIDSVIPLVEEVCEVFPDGG